jgi:aminomethyltransferase
MVALAKIIFCKRAIMAKSSPFEGVHKALSANFAEYSQWLLPSDYGDGAAESCGLYENCAAFDLSSFGRISVKGPGAAELIDRLTTASTDNLCDGRWIWSLVCDSAGRPIDIVRISRTGGSFIIFCSPQKRQRLLDAAASLAGDTQITDITETTAMLALYGPGSFGALTNILPFDIGDIESGDVKTKSIIIMSVTILRGSWIGLDGFELLCPVSAAAMAAGAVAKYHKRENISPAGMDCLNRTMLEASVPVSIMNLPSAANITLPAYGLDGLINSSKDFVGKEAVTRAATCGSEKILVGLSNAGDINIVGGATVEHNGLGIGFCSEMVHSQRLGRSIAMAMIDNEFFDLTESVQIITGNTKTDAKICKLPFDADIAAF